MERLHVPEGPRDILVPRLYHASSISDMVNGKGEVIRTREEEIELWREGLYGIDKILALPIIWESNRMVKSSVFWTVVKLPAIRHHPEKDDPETHDGITIFDPTDNVEVMLPQGDLKRLANYLSNSWGSKFDPQLLKTRSWVSDVALLTAYNGRGENAYFLVFVKNRLASEPTRNTVPFSSNNPSLARGL